MKRRCNESFQVRNSPVKRSRLGDSFFPKTPDHDTSLSTNGRRDNTNFTPPTPYTPYPPHPSDSPTNPFKRKNRLETLPPISSFSKHIALRFQLHRRDVGFHKGGVYRIVQVPLNYPFTHLRALIAWLFDTPAHRTQKALEEEYLFEVKTKIALESPLMKPGIIKVGMTSVKVSNAKDPWRKCYGRDLDDEDELTDESDLDENESLGDKSDDFIWVDEEEYTIGHVWNTGVRADRGIIYYHSPGTQIHITVNGTKLPHRRGKSNVPYVFFARGRIHISPRPLPRPAFSRSILHTLPSSPAGPSTPTKRPKYTGKFSSTNEMTAVPSDTDVGDVDSDRDQDSAAKLFDENHPYFGFRQSMQRKSKWNRFHDAIVRADAKKRVLKSPEIIYVDDSDEENCRKLTDEDKMEAYDCLINPNQWNESHYAFGRYFLSFIDPKGRSNAHVDDEFFEDKKLYDPFDDDDDSEEEYVEEDSMRHPIEVESDSEEGEDSVAESSTPDLTTSSYHTSSSLPPSSPPAQLSSSSPAWHLQLSSEDIDEPFALPASIDPLSLSPGSCLELHPFIVASHYPNKKYTVTPAPPKARKHRLRLERLERRLDKDKKGKYLCAHDEDIEDNNKDEEVDELFDDDVGEEEVEKWVKPSLKDGDEWDPFGDEDEI